MHIAVTGATGFLGRYIVNDLLERGHTCRCWTRPDSDRGGFVEQGKAIEWVTGDLGGARSIAGLLDNVDAVVHAALDRPGDGFRGAEGDISTFVERNVLGTIQLIQQAKRAGVARFVFISTCAVHEVILDDRSLDEAHPSWATTHYGAHKAAIEMFVHSFGLGEMYNICALRPTGIYGIARPIERSKWYDLVHRVKQGKPIASAKGGKEVHAKDVAKAVDILLHAEGVAGQVYNCYDQYVAEQTIAQIAKDITGSNSIIEPLNKGAKHDIETGKIRSLGMEFGGNVLLKETVQAMLAESNR